MYKVKTLSKQNYFILEEEDIVEDVIDSMKKDEILGSNIAVESDLLSIDNICYRKIKSIAGCDSPLTFKKCKVRDAKDLARYINKNMIDVPNTIEYKKRFVETLIIGEFNEFLYIYDDGDLIGLVELCLEEEVPEITSILVFERYRNQGYGKKILKLVENYLSEEYDQVSIVVSDHNEYAMKLYDSMQFATQEIVMYYYRKV